MVVVGAAAEAAEEEEEEEDEEEEEVEGGGEGEGEEAGTADFQCKSWVSKSSMSTRPSRVGLICTTAHPAASRQINRLE